MNLETHNKYFRDVAYNTDESVKWNIHTGIIESRESSLPVGTPNYLKGRSIMKVGHKYRSTDNQIDTQIDRHTDARINRQTDRWTDRQTKRQTDRWTDRQTNRQKTNKQANKQINK